MRRYPSAFDEAVLKHLEFVQANIDRMGRNSFFLKAWSVTLVAAIIALTSRNPSVYFVLVALLPALAFWGLDAFYLGQERDFRKLHRDVVEGKVDPFLMDPVGYAEGVWGWFKSVFSRSVFPFHLTVVLTVVLIVVALLLLPGVSGTPPNGGETAVWLERGSLNE